MKILLIAFFSPLFLLHLSHKVKRAKQVKSLMQKGLLDPEKVDPFLLFSENGGLSYYLYSDTERILGSCYGMCVLQVYT